MWGYSGKHSCSRGVRTVGGFSAFCYDGGGTPITDKILLVAAAKFMSQTRPPPGRSWGMRAQFSSFRGNTQGSVEAPNGVRGRSAALRDKGSLEQY